MSPLVLIEQDMFDPFSEPITKVLICQYCGSNLEFNSERIPSCNCPFSRIKERISLELKRSGGMNFCSTCDGILYMEKNSHGDEEEYCFNCGEFQIVRDGSKGVVN